MNPNTKRLFVSGQLNLANLAVVPIKILKKVLFDQDDRYLLNYRLPVSGYLSQQTGLMQDLGGERLLNSLLGCDVSLLINGNNAILRFVHF